MSDDDFSMAPMPFDPAAALQTMQRALRDLKLAERGNDFELRGKRVIELSMEGAVVQARIARKLMATPEWDTHTINTVAAQRKLLDEIKKRLSRWQAED